MKYTALFFALLLGLSTTHSQDIPYNTSPEWESAPNGHVATGLGLADINGDGWKDIIAANGNDIYRQHLVVYYNNGDGTFPLSPSWSSDDIDYHGHCAVGDIDKDGWVDVAVSVYIGPAGFSEPGKVKVYYNTGGELEGNPSFESIEFYTFSCALGDADADGDLDLAVAASESYGDIWDYGKVFLNNNGQFNENPDWQTSNLMGAMDVEFGDMDSNGFLDLVFICNDYPNAIYLADNNGVIDPDPDWQSSEAITYNNSVDIGYFGDGGFPGFVTTGNDQLGGDGKVRFYDFAFGVPANSMASWVSPPVGYGSGVFLCDVTRDGNPDLIYGGWWHPVEIIKGTGSSFENTTSFTSSTSSVVEAIQLADLGKEAIVPLLDTVTGIRDQSKAVRLKAQTTERILNVYKNGSLLDPGSYCHVPNKNWISFAEPLASSDLLIVEYEHSADPDMVITNWDGSKGNYIFYNTHVSTGDIAEAKLREWTIYPNPASQHAFVESGNPVSFVIAYDIYGEKFSVPVQQVSNTLFMLNLDRLPAGIYFVERDAQKMYFKKLMVIH